MTQPSFYAIIPAHVRYCKELEPSAKLLYGEITALCSQEGYCWATNQYFADLYEVDTTTIQRWIRSLKELNFIVTEVLMEGMQRKRKIWISSEIQKMFARPQKCGDVGAKMHPRGCENEACINTRSTTKNEESPIILASEDILPAAPSTPKNSREHGTNPRALGTNPRVQGTNARRKAEEPPLERALSVMTTPKQHESLLQKMDGDEERVQQCYEVLSQWKISKEIVNGNDYLAILKWVIKAVEKERSKPKAVDREEQDKVLVEKVKNLYPSHPHIIYGYNYIEFLRGRETIHIKFGDYSFKDQVINNLSKMMIDVRLIS